MHEDAIFSTKYMQENIIGTPCKNADFSDIFAFNDPFRSI